MTGQTHLLPASATLARRSDKALKVAVVAGAILPDLPVHGLYAIASAPKRFALGRK